MGQAALPLYRLAAERLHPSSFDASTIPRGIRHSRTAVPTAKRRIVRVLNREAAHFGEMARMIWGVERVSKPREWAVA